MAKPDPSKEFPDSIIQVIEKEISYNAPIRTISTLIPIDSIKFGKDCIELHNAILRKIYQEPKMKLGDRIVGTPTSTHQILLNKNLAGPLKSFAFVTQDGVNTNVNSTAHHLKESVGEYVKNNYGKKGVSIYGLSMMDGYHSVLLTYQIKSGVSTFMLVDQGPATSFLTGKSVFKTAKALDEAISEYVRDRQSKRTKGGYQYPANVQLYKLYPRKK